MHHLEIDMREHIDALFNSVHMDYTDLIAIGFCRPVLKDCILLVINSAIDSKLKWIAGRKGISLDPADILGEIIRNVVKNTKHDVGDTDMLEHVDRRYPGLLGTLGESVERICETVKLILPNSSWRMVDVRVIGERAYITIGEDYRIQDYERLKKFEAAVLKASTEEHQELNDVINKTIERFRTAYPPVFKL